MTLFYDVAIPEMAVKPLIYKSEAEIPTGLRVFVEVGKSLHTGFILGKSKQILPPEIKIKNIKAIIDDAPVITPDLWDMALYADYISLCGAGSALRVILPRSIIMGDKITGTPKFFNYDHKNFSEYCFFNPIDSERYDFYLRELRPGKRTLILFSEKKTAEKFFDSLPEELKNRALLWPKSSSRKKYLQAWLDTHDGKFDLIVGIAGAIFAPFMPQEIIIEDEASSKYFIPPILNISARILAGRRAAFLGAKLIIGGRMPSLRTFKHFKPKEKNFPDKKNIIFSNIEYKETRNEELKGIEGSIPLTISLIKNTYRELMKKNSVIWILDRLGESSEVFCMHCGESVKCHKCGSSMRSENESGILRCKFCGEIQELPDKCEKCGFKFFHGRRPGLEALQKIAEKYYDKIILYTDKSVRIKKNSLYLTTMSGLELCEIIKPSLIAWLDLEFELSFLGHNRKFEIFYYLWESYWRGREKNSDRKVLLQNRKYGMKITKFLPRGWKIFLQQELKEREEFKFPPFGYAIKIETKKSNIREKLLDAFFDANIFVMDPGDDELPLYINIENLEPVRKILNEINFQPNDLKITVQN